MVFSQNPTITDELLSAYIDNAVSDAERAAVEIAIANDVEIAWRVESLRSTVSLLGQLTDVPLPRSFTLDSALLEIAPAGDTLRPSTQSHSTASTGSLWERWLDFWHSGSMVWRNAAAVCAVLLLVFLVGDAALMGETRTTQGETKPFSSKMATDSSAVVMNEIEATPVELATSAVVAMDSESAMRAEEHSVPEPMAATEQTVEESAEIEPMPPAAVAMEPEQDAVEETVLVEEGISDDAPSDGAPSNDSTFEFAAKTPEALAVAPLPVNAATVSAGNVVTTSILRMSPNLESGDGADEPVADLVVAASALDDDQSTPSEEGVQSALPAPPDEAAEPMAADATGMDSIGAASVADATNSEAKSEASPQAMMLTDGATVETDMAVADMKSLENEEAADTDGQEAESTEAESAVVASVSVETPQPEVTATLVGEPAVAEPAVQEAPLADPQAEVTQMSAVAMADSVELSVAAESGQLSSQRAASPSRPLVEESGPDSARLRGLAQLLLAILALIFFVLWLRSRSSSTAVPSQD